MGNPEEKQSWLKTSGLEKPYILHRRLGCSIPLLLCLAVSALLIFLEQPYWIPLVFIIVFPLSHRLGKRVLVNRIVCPACGFNPTRRKSDGEPRLDYHKVLNQLERFEDCPNCGTDQSKSDPEKK
ncbi:hypothetical protein VSU19_05705 [Verrucomicrobiales bacterium BCK34]|nr:hypothetical protein [Verrucomicrobiales bacterium BCK34]